MLAADKVVSSQEGINYTKRKEGMQAISKFVRKRKALVLGGEFFLLITIQIHSINKFIL